MQYFGTYPELRRAEVASFDFYRNTLASAGYFLTAPGLDQLDAVSLLREIGAFLPQYSGETEYDVAYAKGFDGHLYSKSLNQIGPHTEAPLLDPPPRYLALYCHKQARCGGGETQLADGFEFVETLAPRNRKVLDAELVAFVARPRPNDDLVLRAEFPLLTRNASGSQVFRFSHNLFYYGDVNGRLDDHSDKHCTHLSGELQDTIVAGIEFFRSKHVSILIEEGQVLVWDNHRMLHARTAFTDLRRRLTRYWLTA